MGHGVKRNKTVPKLVTLTPYRKYCIRQVIREGLLRIFTDLKGEPVKIPLKRWVSKKVIFEMLHFSVSLFLAPAIVVHAVSCHHQPCSIFPLLAVDKNRPVIRIFCSLE